MSESGCDSSDDCLEVKTNRKNNVSIDDLPEVVFEYILSHLSPYRPLIDCKLVSKSWRLSVIETIAKLKRDFVKSLSTQSIDWLHLSPQLSGPSISPRYSHCSCCLEDSVYVFGGCTIANTTFNDLWRFDLSSRSWIRPIATGQFPSPKACASLVHYNNHLVLFGGWTHSSPYPIQEWRLFQDIHFFDTFTNKWTLITPNSYCPAIAGHSASIIGHHMVVFGGLQTQANNQLPFSSSNDIWVLDLNDFVWHKQTTSANPKPLPRYGHSQVVIDKRHILIIGGSGGPNMLFNDIWMLCIPEDMCDQWLWKSIDVLSKDPTVSPPQINFHPTCKVGNLLVVLSASQKVRTVQCKDGNIFRKPSIRSQYVSASNKSVANTSATTPRLTPQTGSQACMASSPPSPQTTTNSGLRPLSREKNRQRQLEGLDRMEQRLRQLKANTCPTFPVKITSSTIKSPNIESTHSPMQLFVLDISQVVDNYTVKWIQRNHFITEGPEEVILYSLVAGRAEIIMFGGIQKDKNMKHNPNESGLNSNVADIVSNQLHIITAKRTII